MMHVNKVAFFRAFRACPERRPGDVRESRGFQESRAAHRAKRDNPGPTEGSLRVSRDPEEAAEALAWLPGRLEPLDQAERGTRE